MPFLFTPQDVHSSPQAFTHPDRLVRISAVHHAGERLKRSRSEDLRNDLSAQLHKLIEKDDELVQRYAAVTLAQCQDKTGLDFLLKSIAQRVYIADPELDECLRNCWRYPFAVLLNERAYLASISKIDNVKVREFLEESLRLPAEKFYEYTRTSAEYRRAFIELLRKLDAIPGLVPRERRVLDSGYLLSIPAGKQPGFLACPTRGWFLQYYDESALNRDALERGREVLFIAAMDDPEGAAICIYVLEDQETLTEDELTKQFRGESLLRALKSDSPLVPGLVTARFDRPAEVEVLSANGKEYNIIHRAQKAFVRQLVLTPLNAVSATGPHFFVPHSQLEPEDVYALVNAYASQRGYVPARIIDFRDGDNQAEKPICEVLTQSAQKYYFPLPAPYVNHWVILKPCENCIGTGAINCDVCKGTRQVTCDGKFRCFACRGTGKRRDGDRCRLCRGTADLIGCGGSGFHQCSRCTGAKTLVCPKCGGSGEFKPERTCDRCNGARSCDVECNGCKGHGTYEAKCFGCGGSGIHISGGSCYKCNGTGYITRDCRYCTNGYKTISCPKCRGRGVWDAIPCDPCQGRGRVDCWSCSASGKIACEVCRKSGKVNCKKCRGSGKLGCRTCHHAGLLLFKRVDCFMRPRQNISRH
jgi:hypothetical protein